MANVLADDATPNPCPPDIRRDLIRHVAVDGLGYAEQGTEGFESAVEQVLMAICGELAVLGETVALRQFISDRLGWPADDPVDRILQRERYMEDCQRGREAMEHTRSILDNLEARRAARTS